MDLINNTLIYKDNKKYLLNEIKDIYNNLLEDNSLNKMYLDNLLTPSKYIWKFNIFYINELVNLFSFYNIKLAGGAINSIINDYHPANDYDLYFGDRDINLDEFFKDLESLGAIFSFKTKNSYNYKYRKMHLQFIIIDDFIGLSNYDLLNKFDFSACQCLYDYKEAQFILFDEYIKTLFTKKIIINLNLRHPLSSMCRIKKYIDKGYFFNNFEIIKLGMLVNNLKINTYEDFFNEIKGISTQYMENFSEYVQENFDFKNKSFNYMEMINLYNDYSESLDILEKLNNDNSECKRA